MVRDDDLQDMEKELYYTVWSEECKSIPLEKLSKKEQKVISKCIDHAEVNENEFKLLKRTLQKYRPYINKHKPQEAVREYDDVKNIIQTEQDLLDILDNRNNKLIVCLPLDGKEYNLEFEILPIEDARIVETLEFQVSMFQDFTRKEQEVYYKANSGQTITPEEKNILDKIQKEINEKAGEEANEVCNNLLANQLRLPESSDDLEKRKEFWSKFPFNPKFSIFYKVQEKLGLTDYSNEKLFPVSK